MKIYSYLGVILIAAGIVALAYQGIAYTSGEIVVGLGPEHMTSEGLPLPSIMGALMLVSGIVLLAHGKHEWQRKLNEAQNRRWLL